MNLQAIDTRHLHPVRELAARSFSRLWSPQDFAYFLAHDFRLCLGLFSDPHNPRSLQAYFLGLLIQGDLDVISVATAPESRRQGLAERLMREALRQPGVERAFLEVDVENQSAIGLYVKLGFTHLNRRKGYYDQRHDAFVMRWHR